MPLNSKSLIEFGAQVESLAHQARLQEGLKRKPSGTLKELGLRAPPRGKPAILIYDIETAPSLVHTWGQWNTNVTATVRDWYILCFAYKWFGQKAIQFASIRQDPRFEPWTDNDFYVVERLHALFDVADLTMAHYGDQFDKKRSNTRFLFWGLDPPSTYRTLDTKTEARRYFSHYSAALKELGRYHGLGDKVAHHGIDLWLQCMEGQDRAWRLMRKYNRQDVVLLEAFYERIFPWVGSPGHMGKLNWGFWSPGGASCCPKCGAEGSMQKGRTPHRTAVSEFTVFRCQECGGESRARYKDRQTPGTSKVVRFI